MLQRGHRRRTEPERIRGESPPAQAVHGPGRDEEVASRRGRDPHGPGDVAPSEAPSPGAAPRQQTLCDGSPVPRHTTLVMLRASQRRHPARTHDEGAPCRASRRRTPPGGVGGRRERGKRYVSGHQGRKSRSRSTTSGPPRRNLRHAEWSDRRCRRRRFPTYGATKRKQGTGDRVGCS